MKKLLIGFAAIGVVLAVRPVLKRKAREHCEQMAAKCKEKMAQFQAGQGIPEPERPEPTVVRNGDRNEALSTA